MRLIIIYVAANKKPYIDGIYVRGPNIYGMF